MIKHSTGKFSRSEKTQAVSDVVRGRSMVTQLERGKKGLCAVLTIFESIRHLAIIRRFVKSVTKVEHAL